MEIEADNFDEECHERIVESSSPPVAIYKYGDGEFPYIVKYTTESRKQDHCIKAESMPQARLIYGMFNELETEHLPSEQFFHDDEPLIPDAVALGGKQLIAVYYKILFDQKSHLNSIASTSHELSVSKQTISNYLNNIRWDGCYDCGGEELTTTVVEYGGDEIKMGLCNECSAYYTIPEDRNRRSHEDIPQCNSDPHEIIVNHNGDEFLLNHCDACGFYSSTV